MYDVYSNNGYEAGKVIVVLNRNLVPAGSLKYDIRPVLKGLDYQKSEVIFYSKDINDESIEGDIILVYLKNNDKASVMDAVEKLKSNPYVAYAEPDYREQLHIISNDPLYGQLWGTQRVEAPQAWSRTTGSDKISVGVIDTGIDYNHPDIRENMWTSADGRLPNGWNTADNDINSIDTDGHGTHVAGTIGAVGNNRIGITGICWNVKVVSLKFGLDVASAIAAINFANYFHVTILNASWGGRSYSRSLKHAIDQYSGLFVASAGNDGSDNDLVPVYPASYNSDNIISVAATNTFNSLASFSNYGIKSVDIAAPGTSILSLGLMGEYSTQNGTSMAAPHVAGAAALLKSYMPDISTSNLKDIILYSAVRHPRLMGRVSTGGLLDVNAMFELADYLRRTDIRYHGM